MKQPLILALFIASFGFAATAIAQNAGHSPALAEYLKNMDAPSRNLALANGASQCGFRSDTWLKPFNLEFQAQSHSEINRLRLSDADIKIADAENLKVYKAALAATSCTDLRSGTKLDQLDLIRNRITVGYR